MAKPVEIIYIVKGQISGHVPEQVGLPGDTIEWQFSDGPAGDRGSSQDFLDLDEGIRETFAAGVRYNIDEADFTADEWKTYRDVIVELNTEPTSAPLPHPGDTVESVTIPAMETLTLSPEAKAQPDPYIAIAEAGSGEAASHSIPTIEIVELVYKHIKENERIVATYLPYQWEEKLSTESDRITNALTGRILRALYK